MKPQGHHGMLPEQTRDEQARHSFHVSLKNALQFELRPGLDRLYERVGEPTFEKVHGRKPENRHDVREVMEDQPYFRLWSALQRGQQDLYIDSTQEVVERQLPELIERAKGYSQQPRYGSLHLNPDLEIPRYQSGIDQHCVPGSFFLELAEDDVMPGARYDIGIYMYVMGANGAYNEGQANAIIKWVKDTYPDFKPRRILDMGCTGGACTLPYIDAFPGAEVHGIDLSSPCLRYAHARAEAMEKPVHFSQQNAEQTDFPDGHFDLIVSHILLHETSRKATYNIMAECKRLLSPGGLAIHGEVPVRNADLSPFEQWMRDWSTYHNNEPFWGTLHDMSWTDVATRAGFPEDKAIDRIIPSVGTGTFGGFGWLILGAQKPANA